MAKAKIDQKTTTYKAHLKLLGKTYESSGKDVQEAIANFDVPNAKGMGILVVEKGEAKCEKILPPQFVHRLFNSFGLTQEVARKQVFNLFNGL